MSGICDRCNERTSQIVNIAHLPELESFAHLGYRTVCAPCYDDLIAEASSRERKADVARKLIEAVTKKGKERFDDARTTFKQALSDYLATEGGNEDAALKNSKFAERVDRSAEQEAS